MGDREGSYTGKVLNRVSLKKLEGLRILVVDDNPSVRELLKKMLQIMGFQVATEENGRKGFQRFLRDTFDVVITDMEMPEMDGWSLAKKLKNHHPDIPIIMITGNRAPVPYDYGGLINALIYKPFPMEDIREALFDIFKKTSFQDDPAKKRTLNHEKIT